MRFWAAVVCASSMTSAMDPHNLLLNNYSLQLALALAGTTALSLPVPLMLCAAQGICESWRPSNSPPLPLAIIASFLSLSPSLPLALSP